MLKVIQPVRLPWQPVSAVGVPEEGRYFPVRKQVDFLKASEPALPGEAVAGQGEAPRRKG